MGILDLSHPTPIVPQVSDEMHVWIIIWHDEQHLSVQDMQALLDVVSSKQSITS